MKKALLALLLLFPLCAGAQFRWADSVLGYSTQYTTGSWAAYQALGLPDTYPSCGDISSAWASSGADNQREFLELRFTGAAPINRIRIYETNAPGAIDTVYIWNPNTASWVKVDSAIATASAICPRIYQIHLTTTAYNVTRIRIAVNSPAVSSWNEIDAVNVSLLSDSGIIGSDQALCNNYFQPALLTSIDSSFQGAAAAAYQWQRSTDSVNWTNIAGATSITYQPDTLNQSTCFRRKATLGASTTYSNFVALSVQLFFNPNVPGQGVWRLYGYNGADIFLNPANVSSRGFYIDSTLSFHTGNDWNGNGSPSSAVNWQGCSVNADYFSMAAKRRGFTPGFYTFQMPYHDDPGLAFKNGEQIFFTGGCCGTGTIFNIGRLGPNDTLEARFAEYGGGAGMQVVVTLAPLDGGTITASSANICLGDSVLFASATGASGGQGDMFGASYHYQWQDSLSGGSWMNIAGAATATYQTPPITDSAKYFRRKVTDDSAYVAFSNALRISGDTLRGNPAVWGLNEWRLYTYNGLNMSLNPANVQYRGYYTDTALNFSTQNDWNAYESPSQSVKYKGCPVVYDYFTMSMKRVGFPTGPYVISFPSQDDYIDVYKNGVLVLSAGCCNNNPFASIGGLGANDTLEYRFGEQYSSAYLQTFLRQQALFGGANTGDETICGNEQPGVISYNSLPSGGYAPATYAYQWQDSLWGGGLWSNISGATGISYTPDTIHTNHAYRRKVTDNTSAFAYSNSVMKYHADIAGNPADTGNGVWNVYGYQGTDVSLATDVYKGFYIDSALSTSTFNFYCNGCAMSAAPGWQGCAVGADYYTSVFRRRGFPAGNYNVTVYHDDNLNVYKNGTQIYSVGCCPVNTINLGFLNADSVLEYRLVEYGGGNFLETTLTKTDSGIASFRNTACNTYSLVNVSGNNWWDFTDDSGRVIASLNPNGNNLGTVTLNMKHYGVDSASIPKTSGSGIYYMPRYYNWESSAYPSGVFPTNVSVRVYYKGSELDTYKKVTAQPSLTASSLRIYHYDGPNEDCSINNDIGGPVSRPTTTNTFTSSGFYLQASLPSFSEIGVSGGSQALPVTLTGFEARRAGGVAALSWKTVSEFGCKGFDVQRSADGVEFSTIGFVGGSGSTSRPSFYAFTDAKPLGGKNYYRLLQTDMAGRYEASVVRTVDMTRISADAEVSIYPNPVSDALYVQLPLTGPVHIRISNAAGSAVHEEVYHAANDIRIIGVTALPAGIYLVQVSDDQGRHWQERITKK